MGALRDVRVQVGAGLVAALALGLVVGGLLFGGDGPAPVAAPAPSATPSATLPSLVPTGPVVPEADAPAPVAIAIPDLSIDQAMIPLGVTDERKLEVPQEWMDIGWWETGPAPGEAGGAVIAGHVNGDGKPAVFAQLPTLAVGAEVDVRREDGSVATFVVRSKEQFAKDDFPDERMYTFEGPSYLHLVTCGGTFDTTSGHYDDNIVVFAELVGVTPA
jgi:sortase (surface protein transpeptidase)